ncbi:hypothetical protein BS50DRAFT_182788 [Corynespora cassiicola Philippines]|uniref:Uncharacterized protein n=1 Tax=Corynespora cassiicola Philippines TaxID=1448308 RepID=A0A2T2P688_CORCC|nr:hypothetical protein BS50DRAFT_182788 [Corynespora cassiicola Philippines]
MISWSFAWCSTQLPALLPWISTRSRNALSRARVEAFFRYGTPSRSVVPLRRFYRTVAQGRANARYRGCSKGLASSKPPPTDRPKMWASASKIVSASETRCSNQ